MTEDNKMDECKTFVNVVLYIDGAAAPNPGYYGSGVHGYTYLLNSIGKKTNNKPNKYILTTLGYIESTETNKYSLVPDDIIAEAMANVDDDPDSLNKLFDDYNYGLVTPNNYINGYYSYSEQGTNNQGEVLAFINSITDVLSTPLKIKTIYVKTDSSYLLHIVDKVSNNFNWIDKVEKNIDLWQQVTELYNILNQRDIKVIPIKVQGHSTSLGNNLADRLAVLGSRESKINGVDNSKFLIRPATKYWEPNTGNYWESNTGRHTFLKFKQLFFTKILINKNGNSTYSIMEYEKDMEPGRKTNTALFGIIKLSTPAYIVESAIRTFQNNLGNLSIISTLDLNALYSQYNLRYFEAFKEQIYWFNRRNTTMSTLDELPIIYSIIPSGLANQAIDKMVVLQTILDAYDRKDSNDYTFCNVTDKIYLKENKKVATLLPRDTHHVVFDSIEAYGKQFSIPIELGVDVMSRNHFKQLEKEDVIVTIAVTKMSELAYRYYTIVDIKSTGDIGIFCNFYSNLILLQK